MSEREDRARQLALADDRDWGDLRPVERDEYRKRAESEGFPARYLTAIHVCAPNSPNGNPRRCYVVVGGEEIVAVVDEGYEGEAALRGVRERDYVAVMPHRVNVAAAEYKRWIAIGEGEAV